MSARILLIFIFSASAFAVTGNQVWRVPNSTHVPAWGPLNLSDSTNAVTGLLPKANWPAANYAKSSASGSYSNNTATPTDVTNLSVSITTTGRPVKVYLVNVPAVTSSSVQSDGGANRFSQINFVRGSTTISQSIINGGNPQGCGNFIFIESVGAGTYTYKLQVANLNATNGRLTFVINCAIVAEEL